MRMRYETEQLKERVGVIKNHADNLQTEMENYKIRIAELRKKNDEKKKVLEQARNVMEQKKNKAFSDIKREMRKKNAAWNATHDRTGEARVFLCREAASLHNLKQRRRKRGIDYMINGVVIPDIRQLNHINPIQLTVALGHLAHLTVLVASYLGLKLPCEIQLPQMGSPHPYIRYGKARPRELSIEVTLPELSSTDSNRYAVFIEGLSMLAYNVAWICWSQGVEEVVQEVEDVWQPGRNLYYLLLATPTKIVPAAVSAADILLESDPTKSPAPNAIAATGGSKSPPSAHARLATVKKASTINTMFGMVNHACAKEFLGSAKGYEHMDRWKVNAHMLMDRTKFLLLGELTAAEWDLIDDEALEDAIKKPIGQEEFDVRGEGASSLGGMATGGVRVGSKGITISSPRTGTVTPNRGVSVTGSPSKVHASGSPARGESSSSKTRISAVNGGKEVSGGWTKLKSPE